jgi:cell division protein FtsA
MADRRSYRTFAVLDIGTDKVAAAIVVAEAAMAGARPALRIAGLGLQRSKGVKSGVLINLDEVEAIVRAVIGQAERAAGVSVDGVSATVSCGRLGSQHFTARAETEGGFVTGADLERLHAGGLAYAERDGRALLHMNPLGFEVDGLPGVSDPRGLAARRLALSLHAVSADEAPLRNLLLLIERCYLACDGLVATPYASALAATTAEERQLGVTCIDFGAGTTSIATFSDSRFIGAEVVPVGAHHISFDIAKALQTPLAEAERIKTLYGTLVTAQSDDHDIISFPVTGEEDGAVSQTTRARLAGLIRPRVGQILSLVKERLAQNAASAYAGDKLVLTGGASQLLGLAEFVANDFGRPVRIGRPTPIPGLNASIEGPQLSALVGLAMAIARWDQDFSPSPSASRGGRIPVQGYLGRVGSWLKQSL